MVVIIFSILVVIALIAKEELQLNEEIVISISFIITISILKTMLNDSANESFKERSDEQEAVFIQKGQKKKSYYAQLKVITMIFERFYEAGNIIFKANLKVLKNDNIILKKKVQNYIVSEFVSISNSMVESLFKKYLKK